VLSSEQSKLLSRLIKEIEKLNYCIINPALTRLFKSNKKQLLPLYKKQNKMIRRFSQGRLYFELILYQKKT